MAVTKTGTSGNSPEQAKQQQKEEEVRKCLVHFRPKDGWKGEYGLDWIRLGFDWDKEGTNSEGKPYPDNTKNIGKYMTDAKSAKMTYNRDSSKFSLEIEPFDNDNYEEDVLNADGFATYYLFDHGLKRPVIFHNGSYIMLDYDADYDHKGKRIKFNYLFVGARDKKTNAQRKKKYQYEIEYDAGKVVKFTVTDIQTCDSIEFKERKKALEDKTCKKWDLSKDFVKQIFDNRNMDKESLEKDTTHISNLEVQVDSYKVVEVEQANGVVITTQRFEYENGELVKATYMKQGTRYHFSGMKKIIFGYQDKNLHLDSDFLANNNLTLYTLSKRLDVKQATITVSPAIRTYRKVGVISKTVDDQTILTVMQTEGKVHTHTLVNNKLTKQVQNEIIRPFSDDGVLHTYFDDYVNGNLFNARGSKDSPIIPYYYTFLGFTQFGKENKTWRRKVKDQAELKIHTEGDFEKLEFISSNKNIEVKPEKIKSKTETKVTVKLTGLVQKEENIDVKDNTGKLVGKLIVRVFPPVIVNYCLIDVNFLKREGKSLHDAPKGLPQPGSVEWDPDSDDSFINILGQGGVILKKAAHLSYNIVESDDKQKAPSFAQDDDEVEQKESYSNDNPDTWQRFGIYSEKFGENIIINGKSGSLTLAKYLDNGFLNFYPEYQSCVRIYLIDKYYCSNYFESQNGENPRYLNGCIQPGTDGAILIFKKSIEANGGKKNNTVAHELMHIIGLRHNFDQRNQYTFQYDSTTNVMDYTNNPHSLNRYQWEDMNNKASSLMGRLSK